jgi:hypothetical protein
MPVYDSVILSITLFIFTDSKEYTTKRLIVYSLTANLFALIPRAINSEYAVGKRRCKGKMVAASPKEER